MLWDSREDSKHWRYKRRHTILGHWHELKMQMYDEYVGREVERFNRPVEEEVPF